MANVLKERKNKTADANPAGRKMTKIITGVICVLILGTIPWFVQYVSGNFKAYWAVCWGIALLAALIVLLKAVLFWDGWIPIRVRKTVKLLKNLPEGFYILPCISAQKTDCTVVGPTGIFSVYIPETRGRIRIEDTRRSAILTTVSKSGELSEEKISNPISDSRKTTAAVKRWAAWNTNRRVSVKGAVYFCSSDAEVENDTDYPVFCHKKRSELLKFIVNAPIEMDLAVTKEVAEAMRSGK